MDKPSASKRGRGRPAIDDAIAGIVLVHDDPRWRTAKTKRAFFRDRRAVVSLISHEFEHGKSILRGRSLRKESLRRRYYMWLDTLGLQFSDELAFGLPPLPHDEQIDVKAAREVVATVMGDPSLFD